MPKTKSKRKTSTSQVDNGKDAFIKTAIFSVICYAVIYLIACFGALIFDLNKIYDFYISLISFALSSFCTGFFAGSKLRKNGIITGLVFALPANIAVMLISLITVGFKADMSLLVTALVLLASSAVGGIIAVNRRFRR